MEEELPLSTRQSLLWLDAQLHPRARYHNVIETVDIAGSIDAARIQRAWREVARSRDALAMRIDPGAPRQRLATTDPPDLAVIPIDEQALPAWLAARSVVDLHGDRHPWDAALLRIAHDRHVFYLCQDHAITDGTSQLLLVRELSDRVEGSVPATVPGFRDFLASEAAYVASDRSAVDREYWERKVARGAPPFRPYGRVRSSRSIALVRERERAPEGLGARLQSLATTDPFRTFGAPLARMVVFATGLAALVHRITGNPDVVLGVPFANRPTRFAGTCGLLMQQVFLRLQVEEGETFSSLARKVRAETLESIRHGHHCVSDRGLEYVTLNFLPQFPTRFAGLPCRMELLPAPTLGGDAAGEGDFRDTLGVHVRDFPDGNLEVDVDFHRDTFDLETRRRFRGQLLQVLAALAADSDQPVARVDLLDAEERGSVLRAAEGASPASPAHDLVDQLEAQVRRRPAHLAVEGPDGALSYARLEEVSNRLARRLRALGVGRGSRVGVALPRGVKELVTLLATTKAGGAYVPVDPAHPVDRVRVILGDAAPDVLVAPASSPLASNLPAGAVLLPLDDLEAAIDGFDGQRPAAEHAPDDLAYVLFTSGSTGRPKGVEITRGAFANFLRSMAHQPGLLESDRMLAVTTTTFDIAGLELFGPLSVGATTVIAGREAASDPRLLRAQLESGNITVMQATPTTWRLLLDAGWKGDGRIRVLCGGEPLSPETAARLLEAGGEVWNLYGPTETTVWSTVDRVGKGDRGITIGRPIDRTQVYVLDPALRPVPRGVVGEICIGGDGLAKGYLGRPDLTAERFVTAPDVLSGRRIYRTGDLGRLLEDDRFECLGRVDHQVKVRGFRIELGEIESALRAVPGVQEVVVAVAPQPGGDPLLVAYWTGDATREDLFERGKRSVPSYMVPSAYLRVDGFPLTPSGKLDRKALPPPGAEAIPGATTLRPRDDVEERVAAIWREILGIATVGVNQDFFALGGTSLSVIQLRARMEDLGVHLPLKAFFESPTIQGQLARVGRPGTPGEPVDVRLRRGRAGVPPLFCLLGIQLYQDIALELPGDRSVIGVHVPILTQGRCPPVADVARRYVEQIRAIQPHGPYHLAGLCFGGIVAYEAGRQLEGAGERVALVGILDGYLPSSVRVNRRARLVARVVMAAKNPSKALSRVRTHTRSMGRLLLHRMGAKLRRRQEPGAGPDSGDLSFDAPTIIEEVRRYEAVPRPIDARVAVFRATGVRSPTWMQFAPDLGWQRLASRVTIHVVDCQHLEIVRNPNARVVAVALASQMEDSFDG